METTITKTVAHGIYDRIPTGRYIGGIDQISTVKVGEYVMPYTFSAHADSIEINDAKQPEY